MGETPLTHTFSVSILSDLQNPLFFFFKQGQEFIIFFGGCLNLSAHLFIGNMVFIRNVQ